MPVADLALLLKFLQPPASGLQSHLLAAGDVEAIIKVLVFLVIVGFSVAMNLHKWMTKKKAEAQPGNPPNARRENADLSEEVDAFLKSVQQRQQQDRPQGPQRRRTAGRRPAQRSEPATAEVVEAQVVRPTPVPTLVSRLDPFAGEGGPRETLVQEANRFAQQSQKLGAQIDQTDERVAEEIHAKFDHQLGQFDSQQSASDDSTLAASSADTAAADLTAALRLTLSNPRDVRRAIVISEILNPPTERW